MIRTGSIGLDKALGGGWRPGTLNEIWGDPGAAKTTLGLHAAQSVTRARGDVLWIDTVDGVRHMDNAPCVVVARPRNAEDAFTLAEHACMWQDIKLVIIDSANNLVRQRELDGDPEYVPHPQREYKNELTDLKRRAETTKTTVIFISAPRDKERQPVRGTGISEKVLWRVHLHPDVVHQDATREIQVTVKHVPSKVTVHDVARFIVRPGRGIDQAEELTQWGVSTGNIRKDGSWLTFGDIRAQGVRNFAYELSTARYSQTMHTLDMVVRQVAGIS